MEPPKAELPTQENTGIIINGIKYSYSITKSEKEKEKESLIIKLYDPNNISDFYYTYESDVEKLIKDIKFLSICENLDEMIDSLKEIFTNGNVQVEEKDGKFYCPVRDANIDTPNAVCNICLAEQLDF